MTTPASYGRRWGHYHLLDLKYVDSCGECSKGVKAANCRSPSVTVVELGQAVCFTDYS